MLSRKYLSFYCKSRIHNLYFETDCTIWRPTETYVGGGVSLPPPPPPTHTHTYAPDRLVITEAEATKKLCLIMLLTVNKKRMIFRLFCPASTKTFTHTLPTIKSMSSMSSCKWETKTMNSTRRGCSPFYKIFRHIIHHSDRNLA